ncbi:lytic transglycosylase [Pseudoduganella armeniaca]|uniref:Lytic transglycosylase n=2 Tax=Pseudoduganella armeniaca TaxID=2072590 RepID=A0A2R4C5C2_9BURK|nr:lytic transglycosylase [Pseudoduganella armeniaca]
MKLLGSARQLERSDVMRPVAQLPHVVLLCMALAGTPAQAQTAADLIADAVRAEHGEGVPRDLPQAVALYCRAARLGAADAQYALGWMAANGRGMPRDDGAAWRLFALAAEQGHAQARHLLTLLPARQDAALPACLAPPPAAVPSAAAEVDLIPPPEPAYPAGSVPVRRLVDRLAPEYGVDPRLAMAVIAVESGFRPNAVSPRNAQGLMQLIPATAQRFRVRNTFDPEANLRGGLAYLRWLLMRFNGDVQLVAAAYNAGEGAVERHGGVPPYRETQVYVQRIAALYRQAWHALPAAH